MHHLHVLYFHYKKKRDEGGGETKIRKKSNKFKEFKIKKKNHCGRFELSYVMKKQQKRKKEKKTDVLLHLNYIPHACQKSEERKKAYEQVPFSLPPSLPHSSPKLMPRILGEDSIEWIMSRESSFYPLPSTRGLKSPLIPNQAHPHPRPPPFS